MMQMTNGCKKSLNNTGIINYQLNQNFGIKQELSRDI